MAKAARCSSCPVQASRAVRNSPELVTVAVADFDYTAAFPWLTDGVPEAFQAAAEWANRHPGQLTEVEQAFLAAGERPVNDLVRRLGLAQPLVSKHLRVLREVGLVDVRDEGRQRIYRLNGRSLKPIHDWVGGFEEFWSQSFDRLNAYVKRLQRKEGGG